MAFQSTMLVTYMVTSHNNHTVRKSHLLAELQFCADKYKW